MPVPQPLPSQEERLNAFIQKYELSLRETEVFSLIIEGASNGEISAKLFISENTVKFHVRNILKKTGCSNRTELITAMNRSYMILEYYHALISQHFFTDYIELKS